ncbi:MAG: carbon-nitrogen hydrolase family protein [Propionibacteriales bacterium]|nr:carbon-nitrogen hydrolase family protein [Propionibacteriales bacterium]
MSLSVALAQVNSSADPEQNLELVAEQVAAAAAQHADLVVLPEAMMRAFGNPLAPIAEPLDGPWATGVSALAVEHRITVIAGMFTPADGGRVRNTLLACGPDGTITGYDKIHLFDAYGFAESDTVAAGDSPVVINIAGTRVGLTTCYDVRFAELYIELARRGAEVIVVAASWGAGEGKPEQWDLLVRARALDSGSWVLACGQADPAAGPARADEPPTASKAPTGVGHSQIVSPYGISILTAGDGPELLVGTIEPTLAQEVRRTLGVLDNRRLS